MFKLRLIRANYYNGIYLQLLATPAEIGEVWGMLDSISDDIASTRIVGVISNVWNIGQYIKMADVNDSKQFTKLNKIAKIADNLGYEQSWLYEGALAAESVNSLDDVIAIGEQLDQYTLMPDITTNCELGMYFVESGKMSFDESVRPYLDYTRIGTEYYANHGGAYTGCRIQY